MDFSSEGYDLSTSPQARGDAEESFAILTNVHVLDGARNHGASDLGKSVDDAELGIRGDGELSTPPFSPQTIIIPEDWGILRGSSHCAMNS
jgi:hypothetical protein